MPYRGLLYPIHVLKVSAQVISCFPILQIPTKILVDLNQCCLLILIRIEFYSDVNKILLASYNEWKKHSFSTYISVPMNDPITVLIYSIE
jgi:hypothetical protein